MPKKLAFFAATLAFTALALPSLTFASSLSGSQIQSILSLLTAFGADSSTIASVQADLNGTPVPVATCIDLSQDLTLGATDAATGGAVSKLQTLLQSEGYFTYQGPKGYYGFITAQALGRYQLAKGLVSSSNDAAYGITGNQTRASMRCNENPQQQLTNSFTATPTSGAAPIAVTFRGLTNGASDEELDFGDGGSISTNANGDWPNNGIVGHTYLSAGTYAATLYRSMPHVVLGTVTIAVSGSQTNQQAATIDQSSLTSASGNAVISGTALVTGQLDVQIKNKNSADLLGRESVAVTAGQHWSVSFASGPYFSTLSAGSYALNVFGPNNTETSATLTVTGN